MNGDERSAELLRAALRETTGNADADELMRASILAAISDDPSLVEVFQEETSPAQAEFDVHVPGLEGDPHATRADWFGSFVTHMGHAVKEVSKSFSGRARLPVGLRVVGATPGSVRVVLKAPLPQDSLAELERTGDGQSIESKALAAVVTLMDLAERNAEAIEGSPLVAASQRLSGPARKSIRSVASAVAAAGWEIEGELRLRGHKPEEVRLSPMGAAALVAEMDKVVEAIRVEALTGYIDGQRRSLGAMWLLPEGRVRPIEAFVAEDDLMEQVIELGHDPETRVRATFRVVVTYRAGDTTHTTESYELIEISEISEAPQETFWDPRPHDDR